MPAQLTCIDIVFAVSLSPIQKEVFQEEETRLFNVLVALSDNKKKANKPLGSFEDIRKYSKLDYKSFIYAHSMDFFLFPDKAKVFSQKLNKFFDSVKAWTNTENIYVDMEAMKKYLSDDTIFQKVRNKISLEFKMATKFRENPVKKLKAFENNLTHFHDNFSAEFPNKIAFISETLNLDNDVFLLDSVLKFVVRKGIEKMSKVNQEMTSGYLNGNLLSGMVNQVTKAWGKIRHFHHSLNNGEFAGEGLGVVDETEFYNLHKLLPLVYGPTSLNYKHFSKRVISNNN
jgi:hypothetical protein